VGRLADAPSSNIYGRILITWGQLAIWAQGAQQAAPTVNIDLGNYHMIPPNNNWLVNIILYEPISLS
jgi:hypothetical protein